MNFSIYEQNLWTVKASELLAANPQLHSMVLGELAGRGDEEMMVGVSTASGVTRWTIYSEVPFRNGSTAIYHEGQMNLPATARPKVAWATVAVYAGAAVAVGYGLWWWSRRKRGGGMLMALPRSDAMRNFVNRYADYAVSPNSSTKQRAQEAYSAAKAAGIPTRRLVDAAHNQAYVLEYSDARGAPIEITEQTMFRLKGGKRGTLGAIGAHGNKCCPPGAKQLSSGACQDRETKKFVKSVPCARVLPAPRRVGVPEPFPKARW